MTGGGNLGSVTATRQRARKGDGDLLRHEILEAAERLLLETGSEEAVSIRAVADAAGVTPPSIYRHFVDKTHLIFEVCSRQFDLLDDAIEAACEAIDDPVEAMQHRVEATGAAAPAERSWPRRRLACSGRRSLASSAVRRCLRRP